MPGTVTLLVLSRRLTPPASARAFGAFAVVIAVGARRLTVADAAFEAVADETGGAFHDGARFGNRDVASAQAVTVKQTNGGFGEFGRGHGHEGAAAGNAGVGVHDQLDFGDGTFLGKQFAQAAFRGAGRKVFDV